MGFLKIVFLLIARHKDTMVADWSQMAEFIGTQFFQDVHNLESSDSFLDELYFVQLRKFQEDQMTWICLKLRGSKWVLSIVLCKQVGILFFFFPPWWATWRTRSPHQVCFFMWATMKGKILTTDNLQKWSIVVPDWYSLCMSDWETINHLFLSFWIARELEGFLLFDFLV